MGVGPHPGQTYKLKCGGNDGTTVTLSDGKVEFELTGDVEFDYYKVGAEYVFVVHPARGGKSYVGAVAPSATES